MKADLAKLLDDELSAVKAAMANAEHDAGDVDDDPPSEAHEDAYWAYRIYHGLRKLLAIAEAVERAPVVDIYDSRAHGWTVDGDIPDKLNGISVRLLAIGEDG